MDWVDRMDKSEDWVADRVDRMDKDEDQVDWVDWVDMVVDMVLDVDQPLVVS